MTYKFCCRCLAPWWRNCYDFFLLKVSESFALQDNYEKAANY